jgi:flagellar export protein FliJ
MLMTQKYPLAQLLEIKKKRVEEAEKVLKQRREALEAEEKKLQELMEQRDRTAGLYKAKLTELRQGMDEGTVTQEKIAHVQDYLKQVKAQLRQEEQKVQDQTLVRDKAQTAVDEAYAILRQKRVEVEKLELHRDEWQKGVSKEELRLEGIEIDDLGTAMFNVRKNA